MVDRRIKHTKERLKKALTELLEEKHIQAITVSELCKKADINRNTFYFHYSTPVDLLHEMEQEYYQIQTLMYNEAINTGNIKVLLNTVLNQAKSIPEIHSIFQNPKTGSTIQERIDQEISQRIIGLWVKEWKLKNAQTIEWIYTFLSHGVSAVLREWYSDPSSHSSDEIISFIENATHCLIDTVLEQNKSDADHFQ